MVKSGISRETTMASLFNCHYDDLDYCFHRKVVVRIINFNKTANKYLALLCIAPAR